MASSIDATKPVAGNPTTLSVRANFNAAKSEIEALQTGKADLASPAFTGTATFADIDASGSVSFDTLSEHTTDAGVTVEGVLFKDSATLAPNGSLGSPSYSFANDTDTGFYLLGAGLMELSVGGAQAMYWSSSIIGIVPDVTMSGNLNNYDVDTMWDKLNNIEANADVTDAANVAAAGACFPTTSHNIQATWTFSSQPTFDAPVVFQKEVREATNAIPATSGSWTLDPAGGVIRYGTLTGNITSVTLNLATGEYITLIVNPSTFDITWGASVDKWVGGSAPTLTASQDNIIELFMVGTTKYGAYVGVAS